MSIKFPKIVGFYFFLEIEMKTQMNFASYQLHDLGLSNSNCECRELSFSVTELISVG